MRIKDADSPFYIDEEHIYFSEPELAESDFYSSLAQKPAEVSISNSNCAGARAIGSILYRAMFFFLKEYQYLPIGGITADSNYYMPGNSLYEKSITRTEGTYKVIRGIGPKIYTGIKPHSVLIFFEIRNDFRINVPIAKWKDWEGFSVKIVSKNSTPYKGFAQLMKVDDSENGTVKYENKTFAIPLKELYVPCSPSTLGRRDMFEPLHDFANFCDSSDSISTSFEFLSRVFGRILSNGSLALRMNKKGYTCEFERVDFEGL